MLLALFRIRGADGMQMPPYARSDRIGQRFVVLLLNIVRLNIVLNIVCLKHFKTNKWLLSLSLIEAV